MAPQEGRQTPALAPDEVYEILDRRSTELAVWRRQYPAASQLIDLAHIRRSDGEWDELAQFSIKARNIYQFAFLIKSGSLWPLATAITAAFFTLDDYSKRYLGRANSDSGNRYPYPNRLIQLTTSDALLHWASRFYRSTTPTSLMQGVEADCSNSPARFLYRKVVDRKEFDSPAYRDVYEHANELAMLILGDSPERLDAVAEAMVRLYEFPRKLSISEAIEQVRRDVLGMAFSRQLVPENLAASRRLQRLVDASQCIELQSMRPEQQWEIVGDALRSLDHLERSVIVLRHGYELSPAEVSERVNLTLDLVLAVTLSHFRQRVITALARSEYRLGSPWDAAEKVKRLGTPWRAERGLLR